MEVRERIRLIRNLKGLTSTEVAQKIGVSRPMYSLLEGGKRRLTTTHVERISRTLGVSVAELFGEAAPLSGQEQEAQAKATPLFKHLRPINVAVLKERLQPVLKEHTDDAIACLQLWIAAPEELRQVLQAFKEAERKTAGSRG